MKVVTQYPVLRMVCLSLGMMVYGIIPARSQYVSPYNSSGNSRSVSERAYYYQKSNEQKAELERYNRASSTPERRTSSYGRTSTAASSGSADASRTVVYDKIEAADVQGYRIAKLNGKLGVIARNDIVLIPVIYDEIRRNSFGYYLVTLKGESKKIFLK